MKIRNGFVSNSSSSSFVVLLPDNFLEKIDYDKITGGDDEFPLDDFKSLLKQFVCDGGIYNDEIYEYENELDLDNDYEFADLLHEQVEPYILTSIEGGPDEGQYVIITRKEVEEILNKGKELLNN